jgi:hypothetical protein
MIEGVPNVQEGFGVHLRGTRVMESVFKDVWNYIVDCNIAMNWSVSCNGWRNMPEMIGSVYGNVMHSYCTKIVKRYLVHYAKWRFFHSKRNVERIHDERKSLG